MSIRKSTLHLTAIFQKVVCNNSMIKGRIAPLPFGRVSINRISSIPSVASVERASVQILDTGQRSRSRASSVPTCRGWYRIAYTELKGDACVCGIPNHLTSVHHRSYPHEHESSRVGEDGDGTRGWMNPPDQCSSPDARRSRQDSLLSGHRVCHAQPPWRKSHRWMETEETDANRNRVKRRGKRSH